ncbi:MAG: T9SS C-terminal target domain-containing protein, partial [Bacteroidetes bacterium HGW-Bacteroidetes-21]
MECKILNISKMKKYRQIILVLAAGLLISNGSWAYIGPTIKSEGPRSVSAGCVQAATSTEMELNNVRCLIHTGGDMWWDLQGQPKYEIPKNSGKHSLFAGAIWVGGTDVNGQLRLFAQKYRSQGNELWTGPLKAYGPEKASVTPDVCNKYDKHFVVTRNMVAEYRTYWRAKRDNDVDLLNSQFKTYVVPQEILEWPGNNYDPDYDFNLAPYWDEDGNGTYDPEQGDYPFYDLDKILACGTTRELRRPRLYGDETFWWVYNDKGNVHTEVNGAAIGMEVRAQYFAFATNDELNNCTFGNYGLINRSSYTLIDTYFGVWTDADLGDHSDDFVGCDVERGLGYLYNGDEQDGDGNGKTYGLQPPAIGVDFFEGPYQDADGKDNLSNYNPTTGVIDCGRTPIAEGSINGLNFEDGIVDNERWGMRRFLFFNNSSGVTGDPNTAVEVYNLLRGFWKDGTCMTYGGTGYQSSSTCTDFMFPGRPTTDECGWGTAGIPQADWSEESENNSPADRRFVHSAGPFTLEPGAINDITTGMVWARATSGGAWASVGEVKRADDKAQRLFDVCFKIVDGPNAPELSIIEMDRQLIFHIYNIKGSNNYVNVPEDYQEEDPFIVCPEGDPTCDNKYRFEGYQVFQMKDGSSSVTDITNPDKAKLVYQCDIKNGVGRLVNYELDGEINQSKPVLKVDGTDEGIKHSFVLTDDMFATGDKRLVNHKTYYYLVIAYAFNEFKPFYPDQASNLDGQKKPYLASRSGATGAIKAYPAIPHITAPANSGTILNADYGDGPKIRQVEGLGNGNNRLEITTATVNKIMAGAPWRADTVEYQNGLGPISVKIIDPLNLPAYDFKIEFDPTQTTHYSTHINKSKWRLIKLPGTLSSDTVKADQFISVDNEQIIPEWGISVNVQQVTWPGTTPTNPTDNGVLYSAITWNDPTKVWLDMNTTKDDEVCGPMNWIHSGKLNDAENPGCQDYLNVDPGQYFEKIVDGTWGAYRLCSRDYLSTTLPLNTHGVAFHYGHSLIKWYNQRVSSIDFYYTKDKSKWTRSPVIEMCENDFNGGTAFTAGFSEGGQLKFGLRKHASIDKNGVTTNTGSNTQEQYSNFIGDTGMGWFPGYCIDVETGERLNIAYGEDSRYPNQNGRDMLWNPTNTYASDLYYYTGGANGDLYIGGKHYIYVFGHNRTPVDPDYMPAYDYGKFIYDKLVNSTAVNDIGKRDVWKNAMWVTLPMLAQDIAIQTNPSDPYYFIKTEAKVSIRIANPYRQVLGDLAVANPENDNIPMYFFS